MASPNREEMLKMGIRSFKQGNVDGAKMLFRQVLQQDPRNERAMLWMAKLAKSTNERRTWLERVLESDPDNQTAAKALAKITEDEEESESEKALTYGSLTVGVALFLILVFTAIWAFMPLSTV